MQTTPTAIRLRWTMGPLFLLSVLLLFAGTRPVRACTMCLNSDPLANPNGASQSGQWRVTFENRSHSKANGLVDASAEYHEFQHENRLLTQVAYSPAMRLSVSASVPFMDRRHTSYGGTQKIRYTSQGFGDLDLQARYEPLIHHTPGHYMATTLIAGVGVPTGTNDLRADGVRLPEHVQPGIGAWSMTAGVSQQLQSGTYWVYGSALYRHTLKNRFDYDYGDAFLVSTEAGRRVTSRLAVLCGLVGRSTSTEVDERQSSQAYQPETGGEVLSLTPGLQVQVTPFMSARAQAYVTLWNHLNGYQTEDANLLVSLTARP